MGARQEAEQDCEGQGSPLQTYHESYEDIRNHGFGKREAGGRARAGRMPSSQEREECVFLNSKHLATKKCS
ncbi:MAG: hypothetical protein CMI00_09990 [Oceanospirillaceae bacterium]|nr:hypothetical protein [Oceanospirillaceae bacterium]